MGLGLHKCVKEDDLGHLSLLLQCKYGSTVKTNVILFLMGQIQLKLALVCWFFFLSVYAFVNLSNQTKKNLQFFV